MLDQQDADAGSRRSARIVATRPPRLGRVHAGGRFVEHQDRGLRGEGAGDLEAPLIAVRECAGRGASRSISLHAPRATAVARAASIVESAGWAKAPAREVRAYVERAEEPDVLVGAGDPGARDAMRRESVRRALVRARSCRWRAAAHAGDRR